MAQRGHEISSKGEGNGMFSITIYTETEITASPENVWKILTDLGRYKEWNPMITGASGRAEAGSRIRLRFNPPGSKKTVFRPLVLVADKNREFRWQGRPRVPLLFDSEHYFIIEQAGKDKISLTHNMVFFGLMIPFVKRLIRKKTLDAFNLMNRALKEQAETSAS